MATGTRKPDGNDERKRDSKRSQKRMAATWGMLGRLVGKGAVNWQEALHHLATQAQQMLPCQKQSSEGFVRALAQVDSLDYHVKHSALSGGCCSRARAATWKARHHISKDEAAKAKIAHSRAAKARHHMPPYQHDADVAAGGNPSQSYGEAKVGEGVSLPGHLSSVARQPVCFSLEPDSDVEEANFFPDVTPDEQEFLDAHSDLSNMDSFVSLEPDEADEMASQPLPLAPWDKSTQHREMSLQLMRVPVTVMSMLARWTRILMMIRFSVIHTLQHPWRRRQFPYPT